MDDYIRREAALDPGIKVSGLTCEQVQAVKAVMDPYLEYLKKLPAADVRPVQKSYWWTYPDEERTKEGDLMVWCAKCGAEDHHMLGVKVPFCWYCGAEMEEGEKRLWVPPAGAE